MLRRAVSKLEPQEEPMLPCESEGRRKLVSQVKGRRGAFVLLWGRVSFFVLFRPLMSWMRPVHGGEGNLLSLPIQMLTSSRNTQKYCLTISGHQRPSQLDT